MSKLHIFPCSLRIVVFTAVIFGVAACAATADTNLTIPEDSIGYVVRSSGFSAYLFEGPDVDSSEHNPTVTLQRGETYVFDNTTGSGHPFYIKFDSSAGSSNALGESDGVTGSATGTTIFTVPDDAPDQLYYICSLHSAMAGDFSIVD